MALTKGDSVAEENEPGAVQQGRRGEARLHVAVVDLELGGGSVREDQGG